MSPSESAQALRVPQCRSAWRVTGFWRVALALLVLAGLFSWFLRPEAFIADDSYFYLVIARNLAATGRQTFSGVVPTNGVHPLWCYLLAAYGWLVSLVDSSLLWHVRTTIPLSAILLLVGVRNFLRVAGLLRAPAVLLVGIPLTLLLTTRILESEAVLYFAALSYLTLISLDGSLDRRSGPYKAALACACVFFARLDSVFFIACYFVWFGLRAVKPFDIVRLIGVFLIVALPYVLSNLIWFGGMTPISGWMKSSFPIPYLKGFDRYEGLYSSMLFGYRVVWGICPIVASVVLIAIKRAFADRPIPLLYVYLFGSLLHLAYVALFVRSHSIWSWYYVLPVMLFALTLAISIPKRPLWDGIASVAVIAVGAAVLVKAVRSSNAQDALWYPQIESARYVEQNRLSGKGILVSDWPGYLAFRFDNHIVAADMLTCNRKYYKQMKAAPDALAYLIDSHAHAGKPIEYVVWMGNKWLVPQSDLQRLVYNDPRRYPDLVPIGTLSLGRGPVYSAHGGGFLVWRLDAQAR
jgi:hypothetical protein